MSRLFSIICILLFLQNCQNNLTSKQYLSDNLSPNIRKTNSLSTNLGGCAGEISDEDMKSIKILDEDIELMKKNASSALEFATSGSSVKWKNTNTGNSGVIIPIKTFKQNSFYCREYIQKIVVDNVEFTAYSKACRQVDGSWKISQ